MAARLHASQAAVAHRLGDAQVRAWRRQGFTLVHDLLPRAVLQQCFDDAHAYFPAAGTAAAENIRDFGSRQQFVFPARSAACNQITLHPHLLQAVASLLGVEVWDIRLTQSDLWPKYGHPVSAAAHDNQDQRIHCDYPNHSLTHPPRWEEPDAVEIIIYLNDYAQCHGATAVVPRQGADDPAYPWPIVQTPGVAGMDYVNNRQQAEAYLQQVNPQAAEFRRQHLYAREVHAQYQFGSVLFYRHDTWHRGTPLKPGSRRLVHNLTFKKATSEWVNVLHPGWSWSMYHAGQPMEQLLAAATPQQRTVLGFPRPGSPYWNTDTIAAVAARYRAYGIDMQPYQQALNL